MKLAIVFVILSASSFAQATSVDNFIGCYKALKYNGVDVLPASFVSTISVERDAIFYSDLDGKDIPTIEVKAAVKGATFEYYQAAQILWTTGTVIQSGENEVQIDTKAMS